MYTIFVAYNRNKTVKNYLKIFLAVIITFVSALDIGASSCSEKHFGAERSECSSEKNMECFGDENIGRLVSKVLLNVSNVLTPRLTCRNTLICGNSSFRNRYFSPIALNAITNNSLIIVTTIALRI
jgi:hypothetical protein